MKVMKKGPYYNTRKQKEGHATMDGIRDFSEHAARRRPWSKAMGVAALKEYSGLLVSKVQELTNSIELMWRGVSFDFMGVMTFGHEFGMMQSGTDVGGLWQTIENGTTAAAYISHIPWIFPILMSLPGADKEMRKMQALGKYCAERRVEKGSSSKDLFYYLTEEETLNSSKAASGAGDGLLAIIAGSDTAATALTHIWYFLLRNPNCLFQLRKEIDETFPVGHETFDFSKQADLPYLNACINEAMRLYPPVLSGLQRCVEAGGHIICGRYVPENTKVSVHVYTMQRDEREFSPIPNTFWPNRWLHQDRYMLPSGDTITKDQVSTHRGSFLPFSYGPQNCAGKNLAIMEVRAVLSAMVQGLDVRVAEKPGFDLHNWEKTIQDVYVTNRGSLFVNVQVRPQLS
ncbi:hypothetical protein EIP86_000533 [Pleurotus ostreatoroseus]|nr:hypothetical protein EIP86_000533 [Pleurotus ostreatoroseus]